MIIQTKEEIREDLEECKKSSIKVLLEYLAAAKDQDKLKETSCQQDHDNHLTYTEASINPKN
eukprot:10557956-Ditylum_brightwellii.AAC.1